MGKKNIRDLFNATAYDKDGDKLGDVKEVFVDEQTGQPTFVEVSHGLFGMSSSLVPMRGHHFEGEELKLAFGKDRIKDAPEMDADKALSPDEERTVYAHYGVDSLDNVENYDAGRTEAREEHAPAAGHVDGANSNDDTLIRSEERLNVSTDRVASETARLRKYVVTETEQVEVPVSHEEVRLEREPISAEEAAKIKDSHIGEEEVELTLHEERVNVDKETVPVEKVKMSKEQVDGTRTVEGEVRKERFETNADETRR
ncbi:PRC and DUF2382 domain-containing protein [Corynebacterium sp. TAE3-ERU12]|uniref:PRC and DUF2382 domain-containing protein n=1 Tax=Corynebacterium sp. TAE3-ERU12 TaxID=2849491 RepID=UPI001C43791C|nr:PRC and DUF2382 domain-containing protein [Corynebacterium sp. TAE3-ERU12]MBV7295663.1 PRC and DUF2382 domain-containing protein [Corynebacterium sp. TAE3-ERU12]